MAITKNSQIDLNGNEMILDADGDTTITADTDDQIDFKTAGTDKVAIGASGNLFVGSSTSNGISGGTAGLQVTGAGFNGTISASRHDNNQYGSSIMLGKSRNTSVGSNTIVQDNDGIGAITFFADDGTNLDSRVANISAAVDGTPGENDTPGRLVFETTSDGSAAPSERMRIDNSGRVTKPSQPYTAAYRSSNQTVSAVTWTDWSVDTTLENNGTDMRTATSTFTMPVAGVYLCTGVLSIQDVNASNYALARVVFSSHNDVELGIFELTLGASSSTNTYGYDVPINFMFKAVASETMKVQTFSGSGTHVVRGGSASHIEIMLMG